VVRRLYTLCGLTVFAVAMGYLEATVVVYLRAHFYPGGFDFPLQVIDIFTYGVELGREAATLLMLGAIAYLAGSCRMTRLGCFAFTFGLWDIAYYAWLKALLDWPATLLTWDVLFLIPIVWIGPVLAPVLISLLLIAGSVPLLLAESAGKIRACAWEWMVAIVGAGVVLYTFMSDALAAYLAGGPEAVAALVPTHYNWPVFSLGFAMMLLATVSVLRRNRALPR
jgi:hypothetical protein